MREDYYVILMAGGIGSRFWPVSTPDFPKQFQDLMNRGETLIQSTYSRIKDVVPNKNIIILTSHKYKDLVKQNLPSISSSQILCEPTLRNTAPAILYASLKICDLNPDATICVLPCDHWVEDKDLFEKSLLQGLEFCKAKEALVTIGVEPSSPHTGYGYIQYKPDDGPLNKVNQFIEKPNVNIAKKLLKQSSCFWNSGIFIWSVKAILNAYKEYQPQMYEKLHNESIYNTPLESEFIEKNYHSLDNISVDYAIMEKSDKTFTLKATFDWTDLGTWKSLYQKLPKDESQNVCIGDSIKLFESTENIIYSKENKELIINNLHKSIVVNYNDKILISSMDKEQEIKHISSQINSYKK